MDTTNEAAPQPPPTAAALSLTRLIPGENPVSYDDLLARFSATLKPSDIVEETWVRDAVDLTWEVLRLRRLKASLLSGCAHEGMKQVLISIGAGHEHAASRGWIARDPQESRRSEAALAAAGLSMDTVMARTLAERIVEIERIERMTTAAENRRNAALQQIRRNRAVFGDKVRRVVQETDATELRRMAPEHPSATSHR